MVILKCFGPSVCIQIAFALHIWPCRANFFNFLILRNSRFPQKSFTTFTFGKKSVAYKCSTIISLEMQSLEIILNYDSTVVNYNDGVFTRLTTWGSFQSGKTKKEKFNANQKFLETFKTILNQSTNGLRNWGFPILPLVQLSIGTSLWIKNVIP